MKDNLRQYKQDIFKIRNDDAFNRLALTAFRHQLENVAVYREFVTASGHAPERINHYLEIPFLPISFFKTHKIYDNPDFEGLYFTSSGTTGHVPSRHYISDEELYKQSLLHGFRHFYGAPEQYLFMALVPEPSERPDSSLAYMIKVLCEASNRQHSGFYLNRPEKMSEILKNSPENLFIPGVTYALLDFFQSHKLKIPDAVVLETGGMKGKRKEIIRAELHELLTSLTGTKKIHSEYGMSELLSQAYALKDGLFLCPPWMKILIRDAHDPFGYANQKETGIIRVIDLANIHSCCFIETQDLGRMVQDHAFEVLGREDQSEWRGCNLMI